VSADLPSLPHVEPVIAVNPRDPAHLVAAAMAIRDTWTVHVLVSMDGGASWTRRQLPGLGGPRSGDPWLAWSDDGALYLSCLATGEGRRSQEAWLYRSTDGGHSWSDPELIRFADPQGGWADHPVIRADEGGGLHVFATGPSTSISVSRVPARGGGFEPRPAFRLDDHNNNLGSGAAFPDGRFVFSYYSLSVPQPSTLWAVRSSDSGRSYQRTAITPEHVPLVFPMMAAGRAPRSGRARVYVVWTRSFERPHVMIGYSDDYGATWSAPARVHTDSSTVLRTAPTVAVSNAGAVAVVWVESRHHEGHTVDERRALLQQEGAVDCWDVYAAVSRDGAATFSRLIRLSPETTCSNAAGNGEAGRWWGGDYIGAAWDSQGGLHPIWVDSRTGTYQLWTARVEVE
jgi:hypothetical protein